MSEDETGITRRAGLQGSLAASLAAALPIKTAAASSAVNAVIDAAKTGEPISKFIYGAFSEHIQGFIYGALWAQVLSDRKFYYAVDNQDPSVRKWRPPAQPETVRMNSAVPYVGEHSPVVTLSPTQRRGIWQDGNTSTDTRTARGAEPAPPTGTRSRTRSSTGTSATRCSGSGSWAT